MENATYYAALLGWIWHFHDPPLVFRLKVTGLVARTSSILGAGILVLCWVEKVCVGWFVRGFRGRMPRVLE
jgi:hypothetical protein